MHIFVLPPISCAQRVPDAAGLEIALTGGCDAAPKELFAETGMH